jgi:hypothetical protein
VRHVCLAALAHAVHPAGAGPVATEVTRPPGREHSVGRAERWLCAAQARRIGKAWAPLRSGGLSHMSLHQERPIGRRSFAARCRRPNVPGKARWRERHSAGVGHAVRYSAESRARRGRLASEDLTQRVHGILNEALRGRPRAQRVAGDGPLALAPSERSGETKRPCTEGTWVRRVTYRAAGKATQSGGNSGTFASSCPNAAWARRVMLSGGWI